MLARFDNLARREKIGAAAASAVLGILFLKQLVYIPYTRYQEMLLAEHRVAAVRLAKYRNLILQKDDILRLDARSPRNEPDQNRILEDLGRFAKKAGVKIAGAKPQMKPGAGKSAPSLEVDLEIVCSERSLVEFLYSVQKSDLFLRTRRFRLTPAPPSSGGSLLARLTLSAVSSRLPS